MNQEFDLRKSVRRTSSAASVSFHGVFFGDFARLPSGPSESFETVQLSFAISKSADSSNLCLYILFLENFSTNLLFFFLFFFRFYLFLEYIRIFLQFQRGKDFFPSIFAAKTKMKIEDFFLLLLLFSFSRKRFRFFEINEETKRLIENIKFLESTNSSSV